MPENSTHARGLAPAIGPLRTQRDVPLIIAARRTHTVSTPPVVQAVTLTEARDFMRIPLLFTSDNDRITSLIAACQAAIESLLARKLITQTLTLVLDQFEYAQTLLDLGPVTAVTSVTVSGNLVDDTRYRLVHNAPSSPIAQLVSDGTGWPVPLEDFGDIAVVYAVGYGLAVDVPSAIRNAILWFVQVAYDDPIAHLPPVARSLLAPYIESKV